MTYAAEVLADTPVVYWKLDETSGAFLDSSGNSRPTTSIAGTLTRGQTGAVDGGSSVLRVSTGTCGAMRLNETALQVASVTMEALVRTATTGVDQWIGGKWGAAGARSIALLIDSSNRVTVFFRTDTVTTTQTLVDTTGTSVTDNQWHHVAATWNPTSDVLRLYVDGVEKASMSVAGTTMNVNTQSLFFGSANVSARMVDRLDEFAYYGTALSAARILAHAEEGGFYTPPPPQGPAVETDTAVAVDALVTVEVGSVSSGVVTNYYPSPSLETTEDWSANSGSTDPVLDTSKFWTGSKSLHCVRGAGSSSLYGVDASINSYFAGQGAGDYRVTVRQWIPSYVTNTDQGIHVAGAGVTNPGFTANTRRNCWEEVSYVFNWNGSGAVNLYARGAAANSECWIDGIIVTKGSDYQPWFNGDSVDTDTDTYAWTGTVGNSSSTRTYSLPLPRVTETVNPASWATIMGIAEETDTALAAGSLAWYMVGIADETDTAFEVTTPAPAGIAVETDTALSAQGWHRYEVGIAEELDEALRYPPTTARVGIAKEYYYVPDVGGGDTTLRSFGQLNLVVYRYTPISVNVGYEYGSVESHEYRRATVNWGQRTTDAGVPRPANDPRRP